MTQHEQPTRAQQLIGDFAPKLVSLTDNVLFGDIWARPELSPRDRSLITVAALITGGNTEQLPESPRTSSTERTDRTRAEGSDHPPRVLRRLAQSDVSDPGRKGHISRADLISRRPVYLRPSPSCTSTIVPGERFDPELTARWSEAIAAAVEAGDAPTAEQFLNSTRVSICGVDQTSITNAGPCRFAGAAQFGRSWHVDTVSSIGCAQQVGARWSARS